MGVEQTPGPGDYEEKVEKREGFTIGQRLIEKEREDIPGPGNYEGKSFITEGAKYSISQRRDEKVDQTPGPGDYEEIVEKKGGITIGERLKEKQVEDIPGPGNYEEKSTIAEGPSYSIYQRREEKIEQTPGPGDYEEVKKEQRGITIGEKVREKEGEDIPGPGNYEEKSFITEGAKYSIYQRREEKVEQTPGPGDYEEVVEKKGGITMGQRYEDKTGDDHEDEPGPGHYRYYDPQLEGKGVTFTKEKRDKNVDNQVPGPGNYTGISDWAPGYGYEMSISASQFGSQDGYQIIREYEGEDSEGRVIESRRVLRVIHEDEHGNPIEFIDNEAQPYPLQLIGNAIEGTGRVVRTEGGLAQHMFTDSNTQLIQRSQLEGESNNEGGYYIIRRQIRDTETEEQIPEGEGGYIIKRQIIAVGPEQEIEDESSQLIKREIRTFESGEETPKEESYVIKRETKIIIIIN